MALNSNHKYNSTDYGQAGKKYSITKSKELVREIIELAKPHLKVCKEYEPDSDLRINDAPAVKLPNGDLVIAPDIYCETLNGNIFWIEVKDKAQRVFFPDTGADLHQVLGWYRINKELQQPVLVIFKDPDLVSCLPKYKIDESIKNKFQSRWNLFSGKIYGGWLKDLIEVDSKNKYPCIFKEKSRDLTMHILYFHINTMKKIDNFKGLISGNKRELKNIKEMEVYLRKEDRNKILLNKMDDIIKLSYSNS